MKHARDYNFARCRQNGFTMVELCFGLLVTAMVMSAVASLSLAVGQAWRRNEELESLTLRARQAGARIASVVRNGKIITLARAGSAEGSAAGAAVMIWADDTNGDGLIQGSELELIEHDTSLQQLVLYSAGQGNAVQPLTWAVVSNPAVITDFKSGRTGHPIARGIYGAVFAASSITSTTQQPVLEFSLTIKHEQSNGAGGVQPVGQPYTEYGTCAIRAPLPKPS